MDKPYITDVIQNCRPSETITGVFSLFYGQNAVQSTGYNCSLDEGLTESDGATVWGVRDRAATLFVQLTVFVAPFQ